MLAVSKVLNITDQHKLIHLKTINIREYKEDSEICKSCLFDNDKERQFVKFKKNIEIVNFCVNDIEKVTHKTISKLRENVVLSAVAYEICNENENEKDFPFKKLV